MTRCPQSLVLVDIKTRQVSYNFSGLDSSGRCPVVGNVQISVRSQVLLKCVSPEQSYARRTDLLPEPPKSVAVDLVWPSFELRSFK